MPSNPAGEERIKELLDRGDHDRAHQVLLETFGEELRGKLVKDLGDVDAAGEVFLKVFESSRRGLPGFRREASLRTWLFKIARNALIDHLRSPDREVALPPGESPVFEGTPSAVLRRRDQADPFRSRSEAPWVRETIKERFAALREALNDDERVLYELRVIQDLPWTEVQERLAEQGRPISEEALRQRYARMVKKLKDLGSRAGLFEG